MSPPNSSRVIVASTEATPETAASLADGMRQLYEKSELCDLALLVGGERLYAHKAMLAAMSPPFQSFLQKGAAKGGAAGDSVEGAPASAMGELLRPLLAAPADATAAVGEAAPSGGAAGTSALRADQEFDESAIYTIENINAPGKYLNLAGDSQDNGANAHLWDSPTAPATRWRLARSPEGGDAHASFTVESVHVTGRYLNVAGNSRDNGANVHLWDNPATAASCWYLQKVADGIYTIENANAPGKFLNVARNSQENGANVHLWDNGASTASQWRIVNIAAPTDIVMPAPSGSDLPKMELEVTGVSTAESIRVMLKYLYSACTSAPWSYAASTVEVNRDVLRLAKDFKLPHLHESAARWLTKGLTTTNVVSRLVTCEESGLDRLRDSIIEQLSAHPQALTTVCTSPEIMQHPKILQDLLIKVASVNALAEEAKEKQKEKQNNKENQAVSVNAKREADDKPNQQGRPAKVAKKVK